MDDDDSGCWTTITRIGVVLGILASLIAVGGLVFGVLHVGDGSGGASPGAGTTTSQGSQQGTSSQGSQQGTSSQGGQTSPSYGGQTTARPTSTTAPPPPNTVIYRADWSNGSNGWAVGGQWSISNGSLLNDGTQHNGIQYGPIYAPYAPPVADYAVEASIQVIQQKSSPAFGVFVRAPTTNDTGYEAGITGYFDADGYNDRAGLRPHYLDCDPSYPCIPFDPGSGWHTYRLEARGNNLTYLIDGGLALQLTDNQYLSPGRLGVICGDAQIAVRSFQVIAL